MMSSSWVVNFAGQSEAGLPFTTSQRGIQRVVELYGPFHKSVFMETPRSPCPDLGTCQRCVYTISEINMYRSTVYGIVTMGIQQLGSLTAPF